MRIGIDARGKLFRVVDDGLREYADTANDNDLAELESILREQKPTGGSFHTTNHDVSWTEATTRIHHHHQVSLWFSLKKARWIPTKRLSSAPMTIDGLLGTEVER